MFKKMQESCDHPLLAFLANPCFKCYLFFKAIINDNPRE